MDIKDVPRLRVKFPLFMCTDKDARGHGGRESERSGGLENVCASFLKRVLLLPAPVVL